MNARRIIPTVMIVLLPALAAAQSGGGGSSDLRVSGKLISDLPTGDPPLQVNSTTNVTNLSADKLDGFDVGDFATAGSGAGVHYKNLVGVPGGDIDQDCATGTGCFAGDSGGFPVSITEPGSYRLISNLETTDPGQTLIEINSAGGVTLDLQGFRLRGPADCSGVPLSCTDTGAGRGILASTFGVTIRNGTIIGMGSNGLELAAEARVQNVTVKDSGSIGIDVLRNSRISDCIVKQNGFDGIQGGDDSVITDNVAVGNGNDGISTAHSRVVGNTASDNGKYGIECGGECVVRDNRAAGNADIGLRIPGASTIIGNTATENGGSGIINTATSGTVLDNVSSNNGGFGLDLRSSSAYARNVVNGNTAGTVDGGIEVGQNICDFNTTCP